MLEMLGLFFLLKIDSLPDVFEFLESTRCSERTLGLGLGLAILDDTDD